MVTLEMVAQAAGVSASTVSRILNGTAVVSEDKKTAVDEAIARLGYVPNPVARGLAGGRTMSVGIVTQAINSPFYGAALRGIEEALDRAGYAPLFVSGHWNAAEEARCIEVLRSRRVDGIIVLDGRLSDAALRGYAKSMPVAVTGRLLEAPNLVSMNFDNFMGALLGTEHLIELGHRDITCISGDMAHPDAHERLRGYRTALEKAGIAFRPELVAGGLFHEASGHAAMLELLDRKVRFSAVFASNDQMAQGACLALHQRGLRVPQDYSLVGFDDLAVSQYTLPPLTTVHQPALELGLLVAQAMLALLRGEKPNVEVPAPYVVVRQSSQAPKHAL